MYSPDEINPPEIKPANVRCPVCNHLLNGETVYYSRKHTEIVGCENCIKRLDWDDYSEALDVDNPVRRVWL